jgi:hypothetical protein
VLERLDNEYIGTSLNSASLRKTSTLFGSSTLSSSPSPELSHSGASTLSTWVISARTDWFPFKPPVLHHFPGRMHCSSRRNLGCTAAGSNTVVGCSTAAGSNVAADRNMVLRIASV